MGTGKKTRSARPQDGSKPAETEFEWEQRIADETKLMIGHENIDATQMAAFLSAYSRNKVHFSKDKVIDRLEDICKMSNGLISKEDFRKMPNNPKSKFVFKPEVQGILLLLLDTGYFDERKNDRLLSTRENLYREIVVNAALYLNDMDEQVITTSPGFMNAACESILSEKINFRMQALIRTIMHADETVRLKLLEDSYETLTELNERAMRVASRALSTKWVYAHAFGQDREGDLYKGLMSADNLLHFIVMVLAFRVKLPGVNTLPNGEPLTCQNLYASVITEEPFVLSDADTKAHCEEIVNEKAVEGDRARILEKVSAVLDPENPAEKKALEDFEFVLKCHEYWESLSGDEAKASKRMYEAAMQEDMLDILYKFANGPYDSPAIKELQRLGKLRDLGNRNS